MIKQNLGRGDSPSRRKVLCTVGAFIAVFSLVMGLLVLFVIPSRCSFVSSLLLFILGGLFLIGLLNLLIGKLLLRKDM